MYYLKTQDGFYVYRIHGVVFVSFVPENAREHAAPFELDGIDSWIGILSELSGRKLISVAI